MIETNLEGQDPARACYSVRSMAIPSSVRLLGLVLVASALAAARPSTQNVLRRDGVKAFVGGRLFDGTGKPMIEGAVLLVRDGRVVSAGSGSRVRIPVEAQQIDVARRVIVPGFINTHGHVGETRGLSADPANATLEHVTAQLGLYARYGVTTVFSLGGDHEPSFQLRDAQDSVALDRARLYVAGPVIAPTTPEEARRRVGEVAGRGANIVKIRVDDNLGTTAKMPMAVAQAVIDEAHRLGLRVAAHIFYLDDAKGLVKSGVDFIAHSIRDKEVDDELIQLLKRRNVCVCPTLTREVSAYVYETTPAFFADPFFLREADPEVLKQLSAPARQQATHENPATERYKLALAVAMRNLKRLADAGVTIAFGTDSGPPGRFQGFFEHMEMELMTRAGLSPDQILMAATGDAAKCTKLADRVGTLTPGRWADFVVLDGDPFLDITNGRTINSVWIAGNRVERRPAHTSQP